MFARQFASSISVPFVLFYYGQAVFDVDPAKGLVLIEKPDDVTVDYIKAHTDADFHVSENLQTYQQ